MGSTQEVMESKLKSWKSHSDFHVRGGSCGEWKSTTVRCGETKLPADQTGDSGDLDSGNHWWLTDSVALCLRAWGSQQGYRARHTALLSEVARAECWEDLRAVNWHLAWYPSHSWSNQSQPPWVSLLCRMHAESNPGGWRHAKCYTGLKWEKTQERKFLDSSQHLTDCSVKQTETTAIIPSTSSQHR